MRAPRLAGRVGPVARLAGRVGLVARLAAAAGLLAGLCTVVSAGTAVASSTVNGAGSSFAAPELTQWAADTHREPYNLSINYTTSSSGAGRDEYAQGLEDFGSTDIIYNAEDGNYQSQATQQHPFKYVTVSAGGVAFQYNLVIGGQRFTGLNLTQADVCGIFTGEITNWSQLASGQYATQGDTILSSFNQPINVVVRSDSAGESYVLSQYCIAVEPQEWSTFEQWVVQNQYTISYSDPNMAQGLPVSFWPGTLYDNDRSVNSISGAVAASEAVNNPNGNGSITYEAAAYAKNLGAPVASVENGGGYFTQPDANSVQVALSYAVPNSAGTFNLNFTGNSPQAYFPSTYSYILDPTSTSTPDPGINAPLNQFLCYATGQGQNEAASLLYAPLSAQVTSLSVAAIEGTPDAPAASQCGVGGPQPQVSGGGSVTCTKDCGGTGTTGNTVPPPVKNTVPQSGGGGSTGGTTTGGGSTGGASGTGTGGTTTGGSSTGGTGTSPSGTTATGAPAPDTTGSSGTTPSGTPCQPTGATAAVTTTTVAKGRKHHHTTKASTTTTTVCLPSAGATPLGQSSATTNPATPLAVTAASSSSSSPVGDQALWWVLGGALLAAGVSWFAGLTKRNA